MVCPVRRRSAGILGLPMPYAVQTETFEDAAQLPVDKFDAMQEVAKLFRLAGLQSALGIERTP